MYVLNNLGDIVALVAMSIKNYKSQLSQLPCQKLFLQFDNSNVSIIIVRSKISAQDLRIQILPIPHWAIYKSGD